MKSSARFLSERAEASHLKDRDWSRWLVHAHHPDWLRRPEPRPGRIQADRARAALAWNSFRTLALIHPAFWLRQLYARLFGFDERYRVPASLDVHLWAPLLSEDGDADAAAAESDIVDVVPREPGVGVGLLTVFERDVIVTRRDVEGPDPIRRTVDAVGRIAGSRRSFVAWIASSEGTAPMGARLVRRQVAELRIPLGEEQRGPNVLGIGLGTWATVATVLSGAAGAPAVDQPERLALHRCLRCLAACGIVPDDPPHNVRECFGDLP
jgi:hypothetical protein